MCAPAIVLLFALAAPAAADGGRVDTRRMQQGLRALRDDDVQERVRGVGLLSSCRKQPECAPAVRALQRALFDPQPAVRHAVLAALTALDARAAGGDVVRLLQVEHDARVLPAALLALGSLRVAGAEAAVTKFASHPAAAVRAAAMSAAGDLGGAAMRRLVLNSLQMAGDEDSEWLVRSSAVLAMAKIGRAEDLALVQRAYRRGGGRAFWLARAAVARAVTALHPRPREPLELLLADSDPRVAVTAAKGLADAGFSAVLVRHLGNAKSSIRAAAVGGVRQADLRSAGAQLRRMARFDRSRGVRWAAAKVLFAWDDPLGDRLLLDALRSKEATIWAEALALLAQKTGGKHGRDVEAWREDLQRRRKR